MEVKILGAHCAEAEGLRMTSFLIDGILAIDAGGLTSGLSLSEQQKLRSILLTHQHFDHTRDLVTLGANGGVFPAPIDVYGLEETLDVVNCCLLDGRMYVDFSRWPSPEKPFLRLNTIKPGKREIIAGYEVLAEQMNHVVPTVGYQVTSKDGTSLFYTGDTGPGLSACWERISPQLLLVEVAGPNRFGDLLRSVGHLSAGFLKVELTQFRQIKGYLPRVVVVHIPPAYQKEVEEEVEDVARELGIAIEMGYEDMIIVL